MGTQSPGDGADHRIGAAVGILTDTISGPDHIGIVAGSTREHIDPTIAGEHVVERIAGPVQIGRAGEGQVLHMGAQRVGHAALHRIDAFVGQFSHDIARHIDHVGVIVGPTHHGIGPGAAIKQVMALPASQRIVAGQSGQAIVASSPDQDVDAGGPDQRLRERAGDDEGKLVGRTQMAPIGRRERNLQSPGIAGARGPAQRPGGRIETQPSR